MARAFAVPGAAALIFLVWLMPAAGFETATPRPDPKPTAGRDLTPEGRPNPCRPGAVDVVWGTDRGERLYDYPTRTTICAKGGDDTITVRYAKTTVWAGPGNDVIRVKNQRVNEVVAGAGRDRVLADPVLDTWYDAESVRTTSSAGRRGASPASQRAASIAYPAYEPAIRCRVVGNERRLEIDPPPQIRAADVTGKVDWQSVAWSPVLTWWNPATRAWEFVVQNEWLWDRTYDEQVSDFPGNDWRRYTQKQEKWSLWFTALKPGYFRVAVYYYHYATGNVPAHRTYDWVDDHVGEYAEADQRWCYFKQ